MNDYLNYGQPEHDQWIQDEIQIGFQQSPFQSMHVMLDSCRDRGLNDFSNLPESQGGLIGPDFGHIQISANCGGSSIDSLNSFGNLEVSPPCTVNGTAYPFGRIYYGDGGAGGRHLHADLRAFLDRQQVQAPVTFDSDWLLVGHVDEFMSIVPNAVATHGWSVILANPSSAIAILIGPPGVDPELHIPRYVDHNPGSAPGYIVDTVGTLLARPLEFPYPPGTGPTTIQAYNALGGEISVKLDALRSEIAIAFGFSASQDFLDVPVLFDRFQELGGKAVAITPDLANGTVFGTAYIAPDQFLQVANPAVSEEDLNNNYLLDAGEDTNGNGKLDTHRDIFHAQTTTSLPGISVSFIDDWIVYHRGAGEVHCSSNEIRAVPATPVWWATP